MKKTLSLALVLLLLCSMFCGQACAATKVKTEIAGLGSKITASYQREEVSRTITVKPAKGGRTVRLQRYNSEAGEYKTLQTYQTEDADSATVKITFPQKWRACRTGWWRIVVSETDKAEQATKKFTFTSINLAKKKLTAYSACIYCMEDEQLIYGKKIHKRRPQASTTKVMTAIMLLDSGELNGTSKISKKAANTPYGRLNLEKDDVYTNRSLLYAILLQSSNGSAVAIAEGLDGSVSAFAKQMNKKAQALGLEDTHFANPHGLTADGHYSSAYDISLQMSYIYPKSETFRKVIARRKYSFTTVKYKHKKNVKTTDKLKDYSKKHKGGKTGFTTPAGYCFAGVYQHKGKTYAVTVLHSKSDKERRDDMIKLYQYIDKYAATKY